MFCCVSHSSMSGYQYTKLYVAGISRTNCHGLKSSQATNSQRFQGFHSKQSLFTCLLAMQIMAILVELLGFAREKRQPVQEIMTPCSTQLSFGRAVPKATTTSCARNHVPMSVSRSVCTVRRNLWERLT